MAASRSAPPEPAAVFDCPVCDTAKPAARRRLGFALPDAVVAVIRRSRPGWLRSDPVCADCVADAKVEHMRSMLGGDGELTDDETEVLESIRTESVLSTDAELDFEAEDEAEPVIFRLARTFGSWTFFAAIFAFLAVWIGINLIWEPFEPYPVIVFAVTSAVLASMAALQGPIIIMSQRQQRERDRRRARADYRVNLKAELEIQYLDEKVDRLLRSQAEHEPRADDPD